MQNVTITKVGDGKLSENGHYLILQNDPLRLYVRNSLPAPRYCLLAGRDPVKHNGVTYSAYEPERQFFRDCLHSAEEIIYNKPLALEQVVRSQVRETTERFGVSNAENIRVAKLYCQDELANPAVGEAYVIVAVAPEATYPYHAAAVVAIDGQDQVTIEVFARVTDAKNRDASGTFGMYTVGDHNLSFHGFWRTNDLFGTSKAPLTIIIEKI